MSRTKRKSPHWRKAQGETKLTDRDMYRGSMVERTKEGELIGYDEIPASKSGARATRKMRRQQQKRQLRKEVEDARRSEEDT